MELTKQPRVIREDHTPNIETVKRIRWNEIELRIEEAAKIAWVNMNAVQRPSFTPEMLSDFLGSFQWIMRRCATTKVNEDLPIKYVVTTSSTPGIFNLGGDLPLFVRAIETGDREMLRRYAHLCIDNQYLRAVSFHLPVVNITLLEGDALGGGFECALADDILIAEKGVKMGFPEVKFNLYPGMGAYTFLSRRQSFSQTKEFIKSGEILSAEEWYELGVVDVLAEKGQGREAVRAFIERTNKGFESFLKWTPISEQLDK